MHDSSLAGTVVEPLFVTVNGTEKGPVFGSRVGSIVGTVFTVNPPGARGWGGFCPNAGARKEVTKIENNLRNRPALKVRSMTTDLRVS
jgi:hypothetical protein